MEPRLQWILTVQVVLCNTAVLEGIICKEMPPDSAWQLENGVEELPIVFVSKIYSKQVVTFPY